MQPTFRQRLEYWGISLGVSLVTRLPHAALAPLAQVLGFLGYYVDVRGAAVARANIKAAFGDEVTPARVRQIARGSFQTFARTMLELFWSPNLNQKLTEELGFWNRHDLAEPDNNPEDSAIYVCLHFSNFEWLGQFGAYTVYHGPFIAQKLKNPLLGPIFDGLRASTGNYVIPQERAMIKMFKHLRSGGKFSMVGDLTVDPKEGGVLIDVFNGLKMSISPMPAALALRTGAKVVPSECLLEPDGRYRMVCHPSLKFPEGTTEEQITQMCWDALEPSIRRHPEMWLWSYKHWRFKPSDDTARRYPFYANTAKRFDRLIKESAARSTPPSPGK